MALPATWQGKRPQGKSKHAQSSSWEGDGMRLGVGRWVRGCSIVWQGPACSRSKCSDAWQHRTKLGVTQSTAGRAGSVRQDQPLSAGSVGAGTHCGTLCLAQQASQPHVEVLSADQALQSVNLCSGGACRVAPRGQQSGWRLWAGEQRTGRPVRHRGAAELLCTLRPGVPAASP